MLPTQRYIHIYSFFPILGPKLRVFLVTGYITQSSLPINYTRDLCPYFLCYLSDRNNYVFRTNSWAAKPAKPAKPVNPSKQALDAVKASLYADKELKELQKNEIQSRIGIVQL